MIATRFQEHVNAQEQAHAEAHACPEQQARAVLCSICPHACLLEPGQLGQCRARTNKEGVIVPLAWGKPCAVALDPIEKKPLFHFYPGAFTLSLGMAGCNLHCRNCQNSGISQSSPDDPGMSSHTLPPEGLAHLMKHNGVRCVSYTYTEPLVAFEYVRDCARLVHQEGGQNVLVSAAYVQPEPLAELLPFIDAANVDLKSMSDDFYRTNCKGRLNPVLDALKAIQAAGVCLEVTNLVLPTLNDSNDQLKELICFVRDELGTETPLHFSRFFPSHTLRTLPATPEGTLFHAKQMALELGLHHVYVGNVRREPENTNCTHCGKTLIVRNGYTVSSYMVTADGTCPSCSTRLYGRY